MKTKAQPAPETLSEGGAGDGPRSETENQRLVQQLLVHQMELETQNEELMQARLDLEAALGQYTELYDFAPVGYMTLARDGAIGRANLAGARLLGVAREKLAQRRMDQYVTPDSRAVYAAFMNSVFSSRRKVTCDVALRTKAAQPLWVRMEAIRSQAAPGQAKACHAILVDISAARQAQEALRQSDEHFRALARALPDAVYVLELPEQKISYFNHEYFLGYSCAELVADLALLSASHPDDGPAFAAYWQHLLHGATQAPAEYRLRNYDGDWEWVQSRAAVQARDADGQPKQLLVILSIITERRQAGEALRHLSTHDALTGVYNRGYFDEEMARLERGRRFPISLVMADVDELKETNDQLGHAAGDGLLQRVAQVLLAAFRGDDVVARIGGDEFAVLLPDTGAAAAEGSLRRVRQLIEENNANNPGAPIRLSLGMSAAEGQAPLAGVLREADVAMYRDKWAADGT